MYTRLIVAVPGTISEHLESRFDTAATEPLRWSSERKKYVEDADNNN